MATASKGFFIFFKNLLSFGKQTNMDMKHTLSFILFAIISLTVSGQNKDVDELKKLNEAWIGSYPKKDTITLSKILAGDFFLINPSGAKISKSQLLNSAVNSPLIAAQVDNAEVRMISQNVALVIAKASFKHIEGGKEISGQTSYMDVYEKRNGRWVAVAAHVTSLK